MNKWFCWPIKLAPVIHKVLPNFNEHGTRDVKCHKVKLPNSNKRIAIHYAGFRP